MQKTPLLAGAVLALATFCTQSCSQNPEPSAHGLDGGTPDSGGSDAPAVGGSSAGGSSGGSLATGGTSSGGAGGSMTAGGAGGGPPVGSTKFTCNPGTELDGDHEQPGPYTVPEEASGSIEHGSLSPVGSYMSDIYGYAFDYQVYVPDSYSAETGAALMVFQDGMAHYINDIHADVAMDTLIDSGEIPVAIGLFINPTENRADEYDAPDDKYGRFLVEEIIPDVISSEYAIIDDRSAWATIGYSSGGIAAFSIGWYQTEHFQKILTVNASWPNGISRGTNYIDQVLEAPAKDLRVMLMSNPNDIGGTDEGQWFDTNTKMAEALALKGYSYRFVKGDATAGHYPPVQPRHDIANSLRWLWQGCTLN